MGVQASGRGGGTSRTEVQRLIRQAVQGLGPSPSPSQDYVVLTNDFISNVSYGSWTLFSAWNTTPVVNVGGFVASASGVAVPTDGVYMVAYTIRSFTNGATTVRTGLRGALGINGAVTLQGMLPCSYVRNFNNHVVDSLTSPAFPVSLTAGDSIGVMLSRNTSMTFPQRVDADNAKLVVWRFA